MISVADAREIRGAFLRLNAGAAWPPGETPEPSQIYAPMRHRNVLDLNRTIVVGQRGVGKTFWSHALFSRAGRARAADAYDLPELRNVTAQFGFKGGISDDLTPSAAVLASAVERAESHLIVWQAVLVRLLGLPSEHNLPSNLGELAHWLKEHPEAGEKLLRQADRQREQPLLVMFDALDTLAPDWLTIREHTRGLLQLAVLVKGLRNIRLKIFMRPDQIEDASAFRFPDASKLRAERVELQWGPQDLYGLLFFYVLGDDRARPAFVRQLAEQLPGIVTPAGNVQEQYLNFEAFQRTLFASFAGEWMGNAKKRGATYSWLTQHLADANGETTPRGFLTALRAAAEFAAADLNQVIDYRGLHHGVQLASENRVDDLRQDYWWIDYIRTGLAGLETPLGREVLFEAWKKNHVVEHLHSAPREKGLLPLYLALRPHLSALPPDLARALDSDEAALLHTLRLIGVAEIRSNGKVNFPDIFRVAFGMKRRGGVAPRKRSK
jgi:hypothetical protein